MANTLKKEIHLYALRGQRIRVDLETISTDSKAGTGIPADADSLVVKCKVPNSDAHPTLAVSHDGTGEDHVYVDLDDEGLYEVYALSDQLDAPAGTRGAGVFRIWADPLPS